MRNGEVLVSSECVIRGGTLVAHGLDVIEPVARQTEPIPTMTVPPVRPSASQSNHDINPASGTYNRAGPDPLFEVTHGLHTISRYPDHFVHNGPNVSNNHVGLDATTSGSGYMFQGRNVWLNNKQVIRNGAVLPDEDPGQSQPNFSLWD